jgi:hypothetical protein
MEKNENITFFFDEGDLHREHYIDLATLQDEVDNISIQEDDDCEKDVMFIMTNEYELNYTIKQLQVICEYYGLSANKLKKKDIIDMIVAFEVNEDNQEICMKRRELWYYINELKNDKFMRKFVIWDKNT